ncbi:IS110 family transposase, partial [Mycetohabitans sp. B3]|nr:IS110 family transposase [Mycetohabitans sp. B3]
MRTDHLAGVDAENVILATSLELAGAQWKIALHDGRRQSPAVHTIRGAQAALRVQALLEVIERYKQKWSLPQD